MHNCSNIRIIYASLFLIIQSQNTTLVSSGYEGYFKSTVYEGWGGGMIPLSRRHTWRLYTPIENHQVCPVQRLRSGRRRYRRLNSPAFAKCAPSRDFVRSSLRIAYQSGWAILSDYFSKLRIAAIRWSLGTSLKCHIAAIVEKNRQVCPHQSVAKIA